MVSRIFFAFAGGFRSSYRDVNLQLADKILDDWKFLVVNSEMQWVPHSCLDLLLLVGQIAD